MHSNVKPSMAQMKFLRESCANAHDDAMQAATLLSRGLMTATQAGNLKARSMALLVLLNTLPTPDALTLASSHGAALAYTLKRKDDAQIIGPSLLSLPYAHLSFADAQVKVNEQLCDSLICACAYILAKWH